MYRLFVLAAVILLGACTTAYQERGLTGGFSDMRLSQDMYRVTFEGNGFTPSDRAADLALMRAAELTVEQGAEHFAIVDSAGRVTESTITTPTTASTTGSVDIYGNLTANTTIYGGNSYQITRPSAQMTILVVEKPEMFDGHLYDAGVLLRAIGNRYDIESRATSPGSATLSRDSTFGTEVSSETDSYPGTEEQHIQCAGYYQHIMFLFNVNNAPRGIPDWINGDTVETVYALHVRLIVDKREQTNDEIDSVELSLLLDRAENEYRKMPDAEKQEAAARCQSLTVSVVGYADMLNN